MRGLEFYTLGLMVNIRGHSFMTSTRRGRLRWTHADVELCTLTFWGFVNAFLSKHVPNDEMTKQRSSEFWGGKI